MGKKEVLIVDDEADIREIFKLVLEVDGYKVLTASNGKEALELLSQLPDNPALILLDLMMPVMDGWQFLEIKKQTPRIQDIPVVVISAFLDKTQPVPATELLRKPFDLDVVSGIVKKYCDLAS